MKRIICTLAAVAMMVVANTPNSALAATRCNGTVSGKISGGLVVHTGDVCRVNDANVSGGIKMDGGTLRLCNSTVTGGVHANRAEDVVLGDIICGGNQIRDGVKIENTTGQVLIVLDQITGGVTLKKNSSVALKFNTITGGCHQSGSASYTTDSNTISGGGNC